MNWQWTRARGRVLAAAVVLLMPALAAAAPKVTEETVSYDVAGSTVSELLRDMGRRGAVDRDGHRYDADTRWFVTWQYRFQRTDGGCRLEPVTVSLRIQYIMPRLKSGLPVTADVRERWDSFVAHLKTHEQGHGQHGRDAARDVEQTLRRLVRSCDGIDAAANAAARQVISRYNRLDVEYDDKTRHGFTQGAVLR